MIIAGPAGTGKSFLISSIRDGLKQYISNKDVGIEFYAPVAAFTGVAVHNVNGQTIHNMFELPVKGEIENVSLSILNRLREKWKNVCYLIIDEMSMIR